MLNNTINPTDTTATFDTSATSDTFDTTTNTATSDTFDTTTNTATSDTTTNTATFDTSATTNTATSATSDTTNTATTATSDTTTVEHVEEEGILSVNRRTSESSESSSSCSSAGTQSSSDSANKVVVYVDGSRIHSGKNSLGAFAVYVSGQGRDHPESQGYCLRDGHITNQIMELRAALAGLHAIQRMWDPSRFTSSVVYTDSPYLMKCMTQWLPIWQRTGWITKAMRRVKNDILIKMIADLAAALNTRFRYVTPHERSMQGQGQGESRHQRGNRRAAELAAQAARASKKASCRIRHGMKISTSNLLSGG